MAKQALGEADIATRVPNPNAFLCIEVQPAGEIGLPFKSEADSDRLVRGNHGVPVLAKHEPGSQRNCQRSPRGPGQRGSDAQGFRAGRWLCADLNACQGCEVAGGELLEQVEDSSIAVQPHFEIEGTKRCAFEQQSFIPDSDFLDPLAVRRARSKCRNFGLLRAGHVGPHCRNHIMRPHSRSQDCSLSSDVIQNRVQNERPIAGHKSTLVILQVVRKSEG